MAVPFHSLASMTEFKRRAGIASTSNDAVVEDLLGSASAIVERFCRGHFVFRGVDEDDDSIVTDVAITSATLSLAGQPNSAGRALRVVVTDAEQRLTAGRVTITGTNLSDAVITDVIDFVKAESGLNVCTANLYKTVTSVVISGAAGNTSVTRIKVGTAAPFVEHHTIEPAIDTVYTRFKYILQVTELNEDVNRTYGTGTRLTAGNQYEIDKRRGRLVRVGGSATQTFLYGFRVLRATYTCGFASNVLRTNVPDDLADVAIELALLKYRQQERKQQGVSSVSDQAGNVTRFSTGDVTDRMKDQLAPFVRGAYKGAQTWSMDDGPA